MSHEAQPMSDAEFLRATRKRLELTQAQLAKLSGVNISVIGGIEAELRPLSLRTGSRLWVALFRRQVEIIESVYAGSGRILREVIEEDPEAKKLLEHVASYSTGVQFLNEEGLGDAIVPDSRTLRRGPNLAFYGIEAQKTLNQLGAQVGQAFFAGLKPVIEQMNQAIEDRDQEIAELKQRIADLSELRQRIAELEAKVFKSAKESESELIGVSAC